MPAIAAAARSVQFRRTPARSPKPLVATRQPFSSLPSWRRLLDLLEPLFMPLASRPSAPARACRPRTACPPRCRSSRSARAAALPPPRGPSADRTAARSSGRRTDRRRPICLSIFGHSIAGAAGGAGLLQELRERQRLVAGLDLLHVVDVGRIEELRADDREREVGLAAEHLVDALRASRPSSAGPRS